MPDTMDMRSMTQVVKSICGRAAWLQVMSELRCSFGSQGCIQGAVLHHNLCTLLNAAPAADNYLPQMQQLAPRLLPGGWTQSRRSLPCAHCMAWHPSNLA